MNPTPAGYDVIGDVHGCARQLRELLVQLGYAEHGAVFAHPDRRVIFIGDLIDRGPEQVDVVRIARSMVEAGAAHIVAGNHEFNAVTFATEDPARPGSHLRDRKKKLHQHQAFLDQVGLDSPLHHEMIAWFKTLPLWLELDGLRVVHACWDPAAMKVIAEWGDSPMTHLEFMTLANDRSSAEYHAVEHVLKGPEIAITPSYLDKDKTPRDAARMNWWAPDWSNPLATTIISNDVPPK